MRARLTFALVVVAVGSLAAQQGAAPATQRAAGGGGGTVAPGIGGAPPGVPAPTAGNGAPDRGAGRAPARPRRRFAPRPGAPMPAEQEPGPSGPPEPRG